MKGKACRQQQNMVLFKYAWVKVVWKQKFCKNIYFGSLLVGAEIFPRVDESALVSSTVSFLY